LVNLTPAKTSVLTQSSKKTLLPLLVVLFLISYGLMTLLVMEQGRTIQTQRYLIQQLFDDSTKLTAMKSDLLQQQHRAAKPEAKAHSQVQAPSSQAKTPSSQTRKTPSSQVTPRDKALSSQKGKIQKKPLEKPPKDTSDTADERRALSWI
jgi:hypothetical protein